MKSISVTDNEAELLDMISKSIDNFEKNDSVSKKPAESA